MLTQKECYDKYYYSYEHCSAYPYYCDCVEEIFYHNKANIKLTELCGYCWKYPYICRQTLITSDNNTKEV